MADRPDDRDRRRLNWIIVCSLVGAVLATFPTTVYIVLIHGETPTGLFGLAVVAVGGLVRFGIYLGTSNRNGNGNNGKSGRDDPGSSIPPYA